jgi:hypothetical protein
VFQLRKPGIASDTSGAAAAAGRLKEVPGGAIGAQETMTVTVKAVDVKVPSITITTPDGRTLTRKIGDAKNLEGSIPAIASTSRTPRRWSSTPKPRSNAPRRTRSDQVKEEPVSTRCPDIRRWTFQLGLMLSIAAVHHGNIVFAQAASPQDRAAAIKQSLADNQAQLRQYTWIETTEISLKGEVKKKEQKQCSYGPDGKVQKTPLPGAAPAPKQQEQASRRGGGGRRGGGAVKETIVENKVEDLKDYMEKVAALVHEYVPPNPQKIQAVQAAGNMSTQPSGSGAVLSLKDYNKPGDVLAIGFDPAAKKFLSYKVNSYVEKPKDDDVTLAVTFTGLPDGTNYPGQVVLDAPAKKIQVKVTNSDYKKKS